MAGAVKEEADFCFCCFKRQYCYFHFNRWRLRVYDTGADRRSPIQTQERMEVKVQRWDEGNINTQIWFSAPFNSIKPNAILNKTFIFSWIGIINILFKAVSDLMAQLLFCADLRRSHSSLTARLLRKRHWLLWDKELFYNWFYSAVGLFLLGAHTHNTSWTKQPLSCSPLRLFYGFVQLGSYRAVAYNTSLW